MSEAMTYTLVGKPGLACVQGDVSHIGDTLVLSRTLDGERIERYKVIAVQRMIHQISYGPDTYIAAGRVEVYVELIK